MKFVRVVLIALVIIVAGLAVLVTIAFNSSFQTWAVRRALAEEPSLRAQVGAVSVGLDSVRLDDVRLEHHGAVLTMPIVEAELPPVSAALNKKILVRKLVAKGWTLDLTKADRFLVSGSARAAQPVAYRDLIPSLLSTARADAGLLPVPLETFPGIFAKLQLPLDISLDGVDLEGDVLLPPAPGTTRAIRAHVLFGGGGLTAGSEGRFTFNVMANLPGDDVPVKVLTADGTVSATLGAPRVFTKLGARITAAAKGSKFPAGVRLSAEVSATRSAYGEAYTATVAGDSKELASLQVDYSGSTHRLEGKWKLDVSDDDLTPFALGRILPLFDAVGSGRYETDATLSQTRVSGGLNMTADRLTALRHELSPIGAVKLTADFDVSHKGGLVRVDHLRATLSGARPILTVQGLQPFAFNVETGELQVADSTHDLVGLTLQGVPIEWAEPFLPDVLLTGDPLRGEFAASASGGGLSVRSRAPVLISNLNATDAGKLLLHGVSVTLNAEADYTPKGWQVEVTGQGEGRSGPALTGGPASAPPVRFEVKCGRLAGAGEETKATGTLSADLAAVLAQSGWRMRAGGGSPLSQGQLAADFTASLGPKPSVQANFQLTKLAADPSLTAETLPEVTGSIRSEVGPSGKMAVTLPLVVTRGDRKSDLTLNGYWGKMGTGQGFDGQVTSTQLTISDVKVLGVLFASSAEPPALQADPNSSPKPPAVAVWSGVVATAKLALKTVEFPGFTASDVSGIVSIAPSSLKADALRAVLEPGGDCKIDGTLAFVPGAANPYTLQSTVEVNNFDPAPVFKALKQGQAPAVEGKFNLHATVTGDGADLADLQERLKGEGQLTSKGGVFRMLSTDISPKAQNSGKVAMIESFIGSMASAITRHKDAVNKAQAVLDLAKMVAPIQFDQLSLTLSRGADFNTELKDFALISPELRLGGAGKVTYQAGTPILDQPFSMKLKLSARGHAADLLKSAGMVESTPDEFGYVGCTLPITLGGTLAKPDASDLQAALLKTAYEKSGASDWLGKLIP